MKTLLALICIVSTIALQAQQKVEFEIVNGEVRLAQRAEGNDVLLKGDEKVILSVQNPDELNFTLTLKRGNSIIKSFTKTSFERAQELELEGKISFSFTGSVNHALFLVFKQRPPEIQTVIPPNDYTPGYLFYDALELMNLGGGSAAILKYYKVPTDSEKVGTLDNPYLKEFLKVEVLRKISPVTDTSAKAQSLITGSLVSKGITALGGLDVTTLSDGLAKFLVKRTKEELSIAFFEQFKEKLKDIPDLQSLFPQTARAFDAIDEEIYQFHAYIQTLRESFERDLKTLPANLPGIIDNHPDFFAQEKELKALLLSSFYIAGQIQDKQHPGSMLANYPYYILDDLDKNLKAGIQTLQLISSSLKAKEGDSYWISAEELKKFDDQKFLKVYLGLLVEVARMDAITFSGEAMLHATINRGFNNVNDLPKYKSFVKTLASKATLLDKKIKTLNRSGSDSLQIENYYSVVTATVDLLKHINEIKKLPGLENVPLNSDQVALYLDATQTTADVVIDVNRKNYASAIVDVIHLYEIIRKNETGNLVGTIAKTEKKDFRKATKAFKKEPNTLNKESVDRAVSAMINPSTANEWESIERMLYKYGTFAATLAQAKNSDQVADAIEAFTLPAGSSRVKRESFFNVSVNAYTGLFGGWERIRGVDSKAKFNTFGVTAPVGVAASWGHRVFGIPTDKHAWSTSIFISVIDVGALAAFRFQDNEYDLTQPGDTTVAQAPTIKLKDIFSPGVFMSIGIPKTPISLNGGWQVGPNLRKVEVTDSGGTVSTKFSDNFYSRFSVSICVDIPLLSLYNRTRKTK